MSDNASLALERLQDLIHRPHNRQVQRLQQALKRWLLVVDGVARTVAGPTQLADNETADFWLNEYFAALDVRDDIEEMLASGWAARLANASHQWLAEFPDAEFRRLTVPDGEHLIVRSGVANDDERFWWWSRVPSAGVIRRSLEDPSS